MTITLIQNEDLEGILYTSWNFHCEILFRTHGTNNSDFYIKLLHSRLYRIFAMTTGSVTILFQIQCKLFTFNAVLLKTKSISVVGCHSYMTTCKLQKSKLQKSQNSCMNPDEKLKNESYIKFTFFLHRNKKLISLKNDNCKMNTESNTFGYKRLSGSKDICWTKPGHADRRTNLRTRWLQYTPLNFVTLKTQTKPK